MQKQHYIFRTKWIIRASIDKVWPAINDPGQWQKWWPGLKYAEVIKDSNETTGSQIRGAWKSAGGYTVDLLITTTEVKEYNRILFTAKGDLIGKGEWRFTDKGSSTEIDIIWDLQTTRAWMNFLAPILRPIFKRNHNIFMKRGEKGLNGYLCE